MEHVTCRWCGSADGWPGTNECDACWELAHRVRQDPEFARRVLAAVDAQLAVELADAVREGR